MSVKDHFEARRAFAEGLKDHGDTEDVLEWEDLYDTEKIQVRDVFRQLNEATGSHREVSAFQREVRERFAEIGIEARCDIYSEPHKDRLEGVQVPRVTLIRRIEKVEEFDHERMGHEVRSNVLGEKGRDNVQKTQVAPGWSKSGSGLIVPGGTS